MKSAIQGFARRLDRFQQRHAALGFPIAVWKKFTDDQAGNLAALLAFFGFVSLFPTLLILATVLGVVLRHDPGLQQRVLNSALADFPVIGEQLKTNIHSIGRGGAGFVIGAVGMLLGARGMANAAQNALNRVWEVPYVRRPGFPFNWLRSYGMIMVIGTGVLVTVTLSGIGTWAGHAGLGFGVRAGTLALSLVLNVGLFWLGLRLATAREIPGRDLRTGAALAALIWQILQTLGGYVVAHQLRHASSLYGVFGLVLGLIAWLYLQAQLTLFAAEIDVVRVRRLWPRSLFPPPLTPEDQEAYRSYRQVEQRRPAEEIDGGSPGE